MPQLDIIIFFDVVLITSFIFFFAYFFFIRFVLPYVVANLKIRLLQLFKHVNFYLVYFNFMVILKFFFFLLILDFFHFFNSFFYFVQSFFFKNNFKFFLQNSVTGFNVLVDFFLVYFYSFLKKIQIISGIKYVRKFKY